MPPKRAVHEPPLRNHETRIARRRGHPRPSFAASIPTRRRDCGIQGFDRFPSKRAAPELWGGPGEGPPLRNRCRLARRGRILAPRRRDNPLWLSAPRPSAVIPAKAEIRGFAYDRPRRDNPSTPSELISHLPAFAVMGPSLERARIRRREGGGERMDFGKRMMTKAWAWVRAFVAPRRSRVVNSGEEEGLRNPGVVVQQRAVPEPPLHVLEAAFARRPRHNENNPVFDKIRQIHAFIPQIHAFFRQIQDPSERGKNIKSLKIKGLCEKEAPGGGISQGRGICPHLRASAPPRRERRDNPLWLPFAAYDANPSPKRAARAPPLRNRRQHRRRGRIYAPRLRVGEGAGRSPARARADGRIPPVQEAAPSSSGGAPPPLRSSTKGRSRSSGRGKTMVELFSVATSERVCRNLS